MTCAGHEVLMNDESHLAILPMNALTLQVCVRERERLCISTGLNKVTADKRRLVSQSYESAIYNVAGHYTTVR